MDKEHKGELRFSDGTPIGKVVDWRFERDPVEVQSIDFREIFNRKIEGTFTPGEGLNDFIEKMFSEVERTVDVTCYISQQTLWMLQYIAQGKRYPKLKKRKNKARMSKKWRNKNDSH